MGDRPITREAFVPVSARARRAWDRAPVKATGPRLKGQQIWKRVAVKASGDRRDLEAENELAKEGSGARKKIRMIGAKEDISEASWKPTKMDAGFIEVNAEAMTTNKEIDATHRIPRKRTHTDHIITPKKPARRSSRLSLKPLPPSPAKIRTRASFGMTETTADMPTFDISCPLESVVKIAEISPPPEVEPDFAIGVMISSETKLDGSESAEQALSSQLESKPEFSYSLTDLSQAKLLDDEEKLEAEAPIDEEGSGDGDDVVDESDDADDADEDDAYDEPQENELCTDQTTELLNLVYSIDSPTSETELKLSPMKASQSREGAVPEESLSAVPDFDDTEVLRDFLTSVKANKALKLEQQQQRTPLEDVTNSHSPSPQRTKVKAETEAASPTRASPSGTSLTKTSRSEETAEPAGRRRSTRTRIPLRAPTTPVANFIPLRRLDRQDENVVRQRHQEKELAMLTRGNTRKNQKGAIHVKERLEKLSLEKEDPEARQKALKEAFQELVKKHEQIKPSAKGVTWAERLEEFQEWRDWRAANTADQAAAAEQKRTSVRVGMRSSKMALGMAANGTPARKRATRTRTK